MMTSSKDRHAPVELSRRACPNCPRRRSSGQRRCGFLLPGRQESWGLQTVGHSSEGLLLL